MVMPNRFLKFAKTLDAAGLPDASSTRVIGISVVVRSSQILSILAAAIRLLTSEPVASFTRNWSVRREIPIAAATSPTDMPRDTLRHMNSFALDATSPYPRPNDVDARSSKTSSSTISTRLPKPFDGSETSSNASSNAFIAIASDDGVIDEIIGLERSLKPSLWLTQSISMPPGTSMPRLRHPSTTPKARWSPFTNIPHGWGSVFIHFSVSFWSISQ